MRTLPVVTFAVLSLLACQIEELDPKAPLESPEAAGAGAGATGQPSAGGAAGAVTTGAGTDAGSGGAPGAGGGPVASVDGGPTTSTPSPSPGALPMSATFQLTLVPEVVVATARRVNVAIPLAPGALTNVANIELRVGGAPLATARRALASWPDGSIRSVQVQFERVVTANTTVDVVVGQAATGGSLALVPAAQTLVSSGGANLPGVWALLPAAHLAASRVAGPALPSSASAGTPAAAWDRVCNANTFNTAAFNAVRGEQGSWLFDRPTALYRNYQRTGSAAALRSAFLEASIYRDGITGTGSATRIPVAPDDLKYHYTQGLALHYLLTGDDRFREAAENVATRAHDLWPSPGYAGGTDFWTERHAGFGLLAYEWALAVTDDKATTFASWAAAAVGGYASVQGSCPAGYTNAAERCFAHDAEAHGEAYGYFGCSPWMSAILADALDGHADRLAGSGDASGAGLVRESLVRLGRFVANQGRDATGKPYYWAGVGVSSNEVDDFDEHWGESAYLVALAWHWSGKTDAGLRQALDQLTLGLDQHGEAGQLRSFNWQCRSGVMAPFYSRP
ncbi:MAG: hypothetical protein IPG50_24930 [Myxococcales bacterium]|nr:hypothetical protein [Myxococcales bacterium]